MQGAFAITGSGALANEIRTAFISDGLAQIHGTFHVTQNGDRATNNNAKVDPFDEDWFSISVNSTLATSNFVRVYTSEAHGFTSCDTKLEVWIDNGGATYKAYDNDDHVLTPNGYSYIEIPNLINGYTYFIRVQKKTPVSTNVHDVAHYILNLETCDNNLSTGSDLLDDKGIYHVWTNYDAINSDVSLNGQIIIHNGAKLTINSTVEFVNLDEPSIIVEAGGELVLNAQGILTNFPYCNGNEKTWGGIFLKGQTLKNQVPLSNQGLVRINGGTIENAQTAILVGSFDFNVLHSDCGGVVFATDAKFINNKYDVTFSPYSRNLGVGKAIPNISKFTDCEFITNNDYFSFFEIANSINLVGVESIRFNGCKFIDSRNIPFKELKRNGIFGLGSSVNVSCTGKSLQNTCTGNQSEFDGLYIGIRMLGNNFFNNGADLPSHIELSDFDCLNGIILGGHDLAKVYSNTFTCTGYTTISGSNPFINYYSSKAIGMYIDDCNGYAVEDNTFLSNYSSGNNYLVTGSSAGLINTNNRERQNTIYRNNFSNLVVGAQSLGWNKDDFQSKVLEGLYYRCNDYLSNSNDNYVLDDPSNPQTDPLRIGLPKQGGQSDPAANEFGLGYGGGSGAGASLAFHIKNLTPNQFDYWHHDANSNSRVIPEERNNIFQGGTVVKSVKNEDSYLTFSSNVCPSKIPNGAWVPIGDKGIGDGLIIKKKEFEDKIFTVEDGGNTPGIVYDITTATSNDVPNILLSLTTISPNLSEEVLVTLAQQITPFTHQEIQSILLLNPHSGRSPETRDALVSRTDNYPSSYLSAIDSIGQFYTQRDTLLDSLYYYSTAYSRLINTVLQRGLSEETDHFSETIEPLLIASNVLDHKYTLVDLYDQRGTPQTATTLLNTLPVVFDMSPTQVDFHTDYVSLRNTLQNWNVANKNMLALDSLDIDLLLQYYAKDNGISGKVLMPLIANNAISYDPKVFIIDEASSPLFQITNSTNHSDFNNEDALLESISNELSEQAYRKDNLVLYPNPSKEFTKVVYNVNQPEGTIEIRDYLGKIVKRYSLQEPSGEIEISTSHMRNGIYSVSLITNGSNKRRTLIVGR